MTTEQLIYNTAAKDGIPSTLAALMVAQSQHETGNYSSRFFTVGNNAFGYSYNSGSKWQLDKGGPTADNGVAIAQYKSVEDSVHEVTDWIKRRQKEGVFPADLKTIITPEQYAELLKRGGYYGDTEGNYAAALVKFFYNGVQNFKKKVTGNPGTVIVIVAAAGLVIYGVFLYMNRKKLA